MAVRAVAESTVAVGPRGSSASVGLSAGSLATPSRSVERSEASGAADAWGIAAAVSPTTAGAVASAPPFIGPAARTAISNRSAPSRAVRVARCLAGRCLAGRFPGRGERREGLDRLDPPGIEPRPRISARRVPVDPHPGGVLLGHGYLPGSRPGALGPAGPRRSAPVRAGTGRDVMTVRMKVRSMLRSRRRSHIHLHDHVHLRDHVHRHDRFRPQDRVRAHYHAVLRTMGPTPHAGHAVERWSRGQPGHALGDCRSFDRRGTPVR